MHIKSHLMVTFTIGTPQMSQCLPESWNTTSVLTPPLARPPQVLQAVLLRPLPPSRPRSPSPPRRTAAPPTASAARRARRAPAAARRSPGGWDPKHRRRLRKTGSSRSASNASLQEREIFSGLWQEGKSRLCKTRIKRKHFFWGGINSIFTCLPSSKCCFFYPDSQQHSWFRHFGTGSCTLSSAPSCQEAALVL